MNIFLDANICLDLLDTTRPTSRSTVEWYMSHKDDVDLAFYFSGDFITTIYYILTERKKIDKRKVVEAIDALSQEIIPFYINNTDFIEAKNSFFDNMLDDFEDLMILHSALRAGCGSFISYDKHLARLKRYGNMTLSQIE